MEDDTPTPAPEPTPIDLVLASKEYRDAVLLLEGVRGQVTLDMPRAQLFDTLLNVFGLLPPTYSDEAPVEEPTGE